MRNESRTKQAMEAVVARLAALGYEAQWSFQFREELADAEQMRVDVYPGGVFGDADVPLNTIGRTRVQWDLPIAISIRQRVAEPLPEAIDAALAAVEDIASGMRHLYLSSAACNCREVAIEPYYFAGDLDRQNLLASIVRVRVTIEETD